MKGVGMLVGNFELKSIWAWPKLFLIPKRDNVKTRATLNETFTAKYDGVLLELACEQALCLGKKDQNSKFTPLSETTSFPTPFICGVPKPVNVA